MSERRRLVVALLGAACASATTSCTGLVGGRSRPGPPSTNTGGGALCAGAAADPGPSYIRRLTRFEYDNTVRDLLGATSPVTRDFPTEERRLGFDNNAASLTVSPVLAEKYMLAAEQLATAAVASGGALGRIAACDPAAEGIDACGAKLVAAFGRKAFRRPLAAEDTALLTAVFDAGKATDFATGARLVIETALQMPQFLYRVEAGAPPAGGAAVVALDDWEMASRLSYLLWNSMPDDALFAAAEAGKLHAAADVEAQARRMLADPRARAMVASFHGQWLSLADIDGVEKDAAVYPGFTPAIAGLMRRETEAFLDHVVWDGDAAGGTLAALLTAPFTYVNGPLAAYYGIAGVSGDAFVKVDLDPARRAGLLTQGGLLSLAAKANQTSPVHRGKLVRERIFCQELLPPPPDIEIKAPELSPTLTTRERFTQHAADMRCAACHQLMDPIGLGFESFDGAGMYRATENGQPVDDSGEIVGTDVAGPFRGPVELGQRLAASADVERCLVTEWFRYAFGRAETDADRCSLGLIGDRFAAGGGRVQDLVAALAETDAFLYRRITAGGAP